MTTQFSESERNQIQSRLPEGAELLEVLAVGYVEEIEGDQAVIRLDGYPVTVIGTGYLFERGLDDGENKFLSLVRYRCRGCENTDVVRISPE